MVGKGNNSKFSVVLFGEGVNDTSVTHTHTHVAIASLPVIANQSELVLILQHIRWQLYTYYIQALLY